MWAWAHSNYDAKNLPLGVIMHCALVAAIALVPQLQQPRPSTAVRIQSASLYQTETCDALATLLLDAFYGKDAHGPLASAQRKLMHASVAAGERCHVLIDPPHRR